MKLFIGCSSSDDISKEYFLDCQKYLKEILKENDLVFGGSLDGLMGLSYKIAKEYNRNIYTVYTKKYEEEVLNMECNQKYLALNVSDRTEKIINNSEALIFLPGGIGTTHELLKSIDSKRCNEFDKPIIIYNSNNYFDKLINYLDYLYNEKFSNENVKACYYISNSASDTLEYLKNYYK